MPVLPDDTYIIRNVRQKALVLAASMGTIAQCILESEITLPKGLPGDSKFQKEISIQYSPHSEGYKISVLDSFNHRPRVAFPSRIDGLSHEFMFFEEGHVFDDWRLTCHDGHKYSIGLRDGRVLSGKRGDSTWDLRKVAGITDLQKWTFEKIGDLPKPNAVASPITTSITDQYTHRSSLASSTTNAWRRYDPQDECDIKLLDLKRRQAQLHLERQPGVGAFELLQRENVMLTNLEKGHQLGFANKLRDGAGAMVRPSSDWECWTIEPIIKTDKCLNLSRRLLAMAITAMSFKPESNSESKRRRVFRLLWNYHGSRYVLGYESPTRHGQNVMFMERHLTATTATPGLSDAMTFKTITKKNPDCGEHWELKQVQSGTYIFTVPGTGLVLGVRDGIVRLEFARGLPTQEWLITRGPLQGIVHDVP